VPSLVQTPIVGPGNQMRGAGWDPLGTTGAAVDLAGRRCRNRADAPLAVRAGFGTAVTQAARKRPFMCSLLTIPAWHSRILPHLKLITRLWSFEPIKKP
jgi:hypothetical protein